MRLKNNERTNRQICHNVIIVIFEDPVLKSINKWIFIKRIPFLPVISAFAYHANQILLLLAYSGL